jgi:hypothetical protein
MTIDGSGCRASWAALAPTAVPTRRESLTEMTPCALLAGIGLLAIVDPIEEWE